MSIAAPILLTPGPLTTSARTRQAMMVDWGSWDDRFNQLTASLCEQLLAILNGAATHHCVPLQGSGTFAVEAAIGTLVPRDGKVLVLDQRRVRQASGEDLRSARPLVQHFRNR
jgi:2-aminoethylphosphonate-pyruvate transaminase